MNIDASTLGTLATIETALLTFAFTVGSWVATLEFRVRHNARDLKANRSALEDAGRHHKAEMDTMRDNHKAEMEAMRTHHREEMADIRTHHREEMAAVRASHSEEYRALDAKMDAKFGSMARDLNQLIGRVDGSRG